MRWSGILLLLSLSLGCTVIGGKDEPAQAPADAASGADPADGGPPSVIPRPDGAPAGTADAAPVGPDGIHPRIRDTYFVDNDWVYIEWDIVTDATDYTQFAVTDEGPYAWHIDPGAADRGDFLYTYFHRDDICGSFADAATAAGTHAIWVQIWPGDDDTRAESADVIGSMTCP